MYGETKTKYDRTNKQAHNGELPKPLFWLLVAIVVIALIGAGHFDYQAVQAGLIH